ncbi:M56 family metallopeptidase [Singulisphaera sp. PoT]|uniref:M56 family metallopeptidase n=1 Tax=Singulisphaera sp. PoT TaxID=3411797 RepID=UPI003BF56A53
MIAMNEQTWRWVELAGHWLLAWTLVVLAVAAWIGVARPRRVALRYWAWCSATFAGAALLPIFLLLGPQVSWSEALARINVGVDVGTRPVERKVETSRERFVSWFEGYSAFMPREEPQEHEKAVQQGPAMGAMVEASTTEVTMKVGREGNRWASVVIAAWALGFAAFVARLIVAAARVRTLIAEGEAVASSHELADEMEASRQALGLRRRVRLIIHPRIKAPLCAGLRRATILWPTRENCPMTPDQRRASLTHELAHLRNLDDWVGLLAEAWRATAWFYPPVHWLLGRLQLERESRCDEIAAGHLGSPESYARWLLDLAPVGVRPPALASSLLGGSDLAIRIRRLLDGRSLGSRPLGRGQVLMCACLALVLLGAAGSVRLVGFSALAEEPKGKAEAAAVGDDAPLPEIKPKDLAAKIVESQERYKAGLLVVEFEEERGPFPPARGAAAKKDDKTEGEEIKFPGRFQYAGDGRRWRVEEDTITTNYSTRKNMPLQTASGFDGSRHYRWTSQGNLVVLGESDLSGPSCSPLEKFWHTSKNLLEMLDKPDVKIGQRTVDGVRCYTIETSTTVDGILWGTEYVVSPRRSYLAVGLTYQRGGRVYFSHQLEALRQKDQGLWFPSRITSGSVPEPGKRLNQHAVRRQMQIIRCEPGGTFPDEDYRFKLPANADVRDLATGTSYANDPWWPEVGKLLREKFDWPKVDLDPLRRVQTHGEPPSLGKAAPAFEVVEWINSPPLDWAGLKGKVVLLDFAALGVNHEAFAPLRKLRETYGGLGFEVISIMTPHDAPDEVRQLVKELDIKHPVAIDRPHEPDYGAMRKAFGMTNEISSFLVDREGVIHKIPLEQLIPELVRLLKTPNGPEVEPLSLDHAEFSDDMRKAVDEAWQGWTRQEVTDARISGKVIDATGQPVPNAKATLMLRASVQMFSNAHFMFQAADKREAATGADGSFTFPNIGKGNYAIRVTAPELATVERLTVIEPGFAENTVLVDMPQGDVIRGQVVDEEGRPVVGAEMVLNERKLPHPNGSETNYNDFLEGKVTDELGQFRFHGLSEGVYNLKAKLDGFLEAKEERVPAGSTEIRLLLRRAGK